MDALLEILKTLNSLSPLAVIALLVLVLFYQIKNKTSTDSSFSTLTSNHLHELPAILETLQRIEVMSTNAFATILARMPLHPDLHRDRKDG